MRTYRAIFVDVYMELRIFGEQKEAVGSSRNKGSHIMIKKASKRFACTQCDFRCTDRSHLKRHECTHTGERPIACTKCDFRCTDRSHLKRHECTHTGERPIACTQCDFRCAEISNLRHHMLMHTGEKPFACTQCDYRCNRSSAVQKRSTPESSRSVGG